MKSCQCALLKLVKVLLLSDFLGLWAINVVVSIGRWSDGSFLSIVLVVLEAMCIGIIVRSVVVVVGGFG